MCKKTLIMLMGAPGAGKSTLGLRLHDEKDWKCYELDRCNWMLPFFASEEDKVVIDCTNHDERSWFEYLADFYDYRKILIYVDTDVDTCLQRRDHLDREYIQEVHDGCERMWDMRYEFFDKAMRISA